MSSVSGIRLPGLATNMDTGTMVKEMLAGEQHKVDKVKQKEQTTKWQQEVYREVIKDMKGFNDNYFSLSSKNSILNSSSWSTLTVNSSNSNIITASGTAGANKIDYKFNVKKLAQPAKATSSIKIDSSQTKLSDIGFSKDADIKLQLGKDKDGKTIYSDKIEIKTTDTVESLSKKINEASGGKIKASYSQLTKEFTIESTQIGSSAEFSIVEAELRPGETELKSSDKLGFLFNKEELDSSGNPISVPLSEFKGTPTDIRVLSKDGKTEISKIEQESNSFTIDGIKYNVNAIGEADITSKQDAKPVVDNMKKFVEDYNKIMDKVYDLVTQKANKDYPPLTEAQKEDMSEDEIERWEKKAKQGILRNDSEMRRFMDDMQKSIFGDKMEILSEMGLTSHEDYNKRGQISLNEEKFTKALENNGEKVYEVFAKDSSSVIENMRSTMNKYVGGSSSVFAKKAGIEKTASIANNFYSEQLKRQGEAIKMLQMKMDKKESELYKKFGGLEASMNKLNSQMSYFMQA